MELPEKLADRLDEQAGAERRTRTTVIIMALEQYLERVAGSSNQGRNKQGA
jgi:predicted transcriptional regulator